MSARKQGLAILTGLFLCPVIAGADVDGCLVFPHDNVWNARVDTLPVHPRSADYVNSIGPARGLHADFGAGMWNGGPIGIPFVVVPGTQARVPVSFDYDDESDPGPYPIPPDPPIEGGPASSGDRHILIVDRDACVLYELYAAYPQGDGSWHAGSGAIFDLNSHGLRPAGWTSADAAGLAVLPGLARYEEVASGEIRHALRFTAQVTQRSYVWPARHYASSNTSPLVPPMGQRFRLQASFDVSPYPPDVQVILQALKTYGMILADNGSNWFISGAPDPRWNDDVLALLSQIKGSNFEAVDVSGLIADPDSGQILPVSPPAWPFDADGRADIGVFRPGTSQWLVLRSSAAFGGAVAFGAPGLGDLPVPADYDGDGTRDLAVYRGSTGQWLVLRSSDGAMQVLGWGAPASGDLPVPADYDGDGKADLAVYRASTGQWLVLGSATGFGGPVPFGAPGLGDRPVPADYDGDGRADLAVYRGSTGEWLIFGSATEFEKPVSFGAPGFGDRPVPADYDGDGRADLAVYRGSTGEWLIFGSATGFGGPVFFGAPSLGDVPLR